MISVLMPTRERPGLAADSLMSAASYATYVHEILRRLDDDDPRRAEYENNAWITGPLFPWTVWFVSGPRYGYEQLHLYYNELAERARGDWLLLWNDDAQMLTLGWDEQFKCLDPSRPLVATPGGVDHPFPIISRGFYQALGHFSAAPHCDTWVCEVAKAAGCLGSVDYEIEHLRHLLDDDTKRDGERAQEQVTRPLMETPEIRALLATDVEKVKAAMQVTA